MNLLSRHPRLSGIVLPAVAFGLIAVLFGCPAKQTPAPPKNRTAAGTAVFGVVSRAGELTVKMRRRIEARLFRYVSAGFGRPPLNPQAVQKRLGTEMCREVRDMYKTTGGLRAPLSSRIQQQIRVRYMILARIDSDETTKKPVQGGIDPPPRADRPLHRKITMNTRRTVTVSLDVVDLTDAVAVWGGRLEQSAVRRFVYEDRDGELVRLRPGGGGQNERLGYPPPPDRLARLDSLFRRFADQMPGPAMWAK